jgi:hypothetical protein
MTHNDRLQPSGRRNPCPICGRTADGDCRIGFDLVLCHHGSTTAPPDSLRIGEVLNGWAYTGETADGRCSIFTPDRKTRRQAPIRSDKARLKPRQKLTAIKLARLPKAAAEPPTHLPDGMRLTYSPKQWVVVDGKRFIPHHTDEQGSTHIGAGDEPWPLYRQQDAIEHARDQWVVEMEGEKCCRWVMAAGRVGISQPGHNHTQEAITRRYGQLKAAGVAGVIYVADNDQTGSKKAEKCASSAEAAGLPFLWFSADRIWGDELPIGGSIDDATGTAAERLCALEVAIEAHLDRPSDEPSAPSRDLSAALERCAERALEMPLEHRHHTLRSLAKDLGASLSPRDVDRLMAAARSRRDGSGAVRRGGRTLEVRSTPWLWQDLLIGQAINIMGALPKVGKTSLLIQAIAAWHMGTDSFLGQRFLGSCPPVILIGSDQPAADWSRMLQGAHLHPGADHEGRITPIREIWTMEDGFALNESGLDVCAELARDYPGALFLIDSVAAAVTNPLGIPEESADIAEPLRRLQAAVGCHGGTSVFIAHAGKGRAGDDPIRSLRGSTSLPAVASQILGLSRLSDAPGDDRLILQTQGRGGHPLRLLLSRDLQGRFVCEGDAASVIVIQQLQNAEDKLTDDQAEVLHHLRRRHDDGVQTSVSDLANDNSRAATDRARTLLKGLKRAGLVTSRMTSTPVGRREWWEPVILQKQSSHPDHPQPSLPCSDRRSEATGGCEASQVGPLFRTTAELMSHCAQTLGGASPQEIALCCADQHPELLHEQLDELVAIAQQICA